MACREWRVQLYQEQKDHFWPPAGRHILAQYDDDTVVVYQAFCPNIADYAVKNQRFGGDHFSYARMSWIKTNFLWMMFRCGWASKKNQERVLAVRIKREGFDHILSKAVTGAQEKELGCGSSDVRLQWDPDHNPHGGPMKRRAIQLGMKNEVLSKYGQEWIVGITDITPFVLEQYRFVECDQLDRLMVAEERVYHVTSPATALQLQVDSLDPVCSDSAI